MDKFLLLVREDLTRLQAQTPAFREWCTQQMVEWMAELSQSGNLANGEPLLTYGRYVDKDNVYTDGPFVEAKEAVSGYIMIMAENIDQAASIAQTCPRVVSGDIAMEVRPVVVLNGPSNHRY